MATEITSTDIATAALKPAEIESEAGRVKQRPIDELIAADQYLDGQTASSQGHRGLRFTKLIPGGTD